MHLVWLNKAQGVPRNVQNGSPNAENYLLLNFPSVSYSCFVFRPMSFASFIAKLEYVEGTGRGFSNVSISSPERIGNASKRQDVAS